MYFLTVWARYSSAVAIFLLTGLPLPIKQWWKPRFKPYKLRMKPDKLVTGMVGEVKRIWKNFHIFKKNYASDQQIYPEHLSHRV